MNKTDTVGQPFEYLFTVRLHDTDAAGRLFFAHLFRHAHDAFEAFMAASGVPLDALIRAGQILLPLTHAAADYHHPLLHGDMIRVQVIVVEIRRRSFSIQYLFLNHHGECAATVRTVHCQINADGSAAAALAVELNAVLQSTLERQHCVFTAAIKTAD